MKHDLSAIDHLFKQRVEDCSIAVAEFDHRAHLQLAYIYLVENNTDTSNNLVRKTLNKLLIHNNIEPTSKYHETLTKAWLLAVNQFMKNSESTTSADDFINNNPELLDSNIMMRHYSEQRLFSDAARDSYMEPDLAPIA